MRRVGFGAMQLAGPGVFGPPADPDAARAVLRRAAELGVDHIDTAQTYGPDTVNELIAEALHPYPEDLVIATKAGGRRDDQGGWNFAGRPEELRATVERDLVTLRRERIDLVNLRRGVGGVNPVPLAEQLGALTELREEGKLDLIGISTVPLEVVREALEITPIATVAAKHGVTGSQVALAWLLAHYERMLLIPGTSSVAHLEENLAVAEIELDDEDLATLEDVAHLGAPAF